VRLNLRDAESGAALIGAAEFALRADAPPNCAPPTEGCLPGDATPSAPGKAP
jgi:hypothetical protein